MGVMVPAELSSWIVVGCGLESCHYSKRLLGRALRVRGSFPRSIWCIVCVSGYKFAVDLGSRNVCM